jgi:hypothetical protein
MSWGIQCWQPAVVTTPWLRRQRTKHGSCTACLTCARVLQGYSPGFPVLLPVGVSALRAQQLVGHLLDGNYLDAAGSKGLRAELLVYNPDLQLLGYAAASFTWTRHGQVEGEARAERGAGV